MKEKSPARQTWLHRYFSFIERRGPFDRLLFHIVLAVFVISALGALIQLNKSFLTTVPTHGGTLIEGVVGTPRFVNPVLAITRADRDMVSLIYSGLMKLDESGELVPDIATSIEVSDDGRTYAITLREDIYFHNGEQLTARDVAYTIALIQNPELKSPLLGNWDGVIVEELGTFSFNLVLEEAYAPFIENLTVGILPRDIWNELPIEQLPFSQNNTQPVGTGAYKVAEVIRNKSGLIDSYKLTVANNYHNTPNLTELIFNFYTNEDDLFAALTEGEIMSTAGITPKMLGSVDTDTYSITETALPRTFAIYFNQNKSITLRDQAVREALSVAIDREDLIATVLDGHALETTSPIPATFSPLTETEEVENIDRLTQARGILTAAGWSQNDTGQWQIETAEEDVIPLEVSISTANTPLFDTTATYVAGVWEELGVVVHVAQFEQADLVQAIIRPRDFQALLFGADIGRQIDLYPFWHSSQKEDPGLNIAQYTNIEVDALLEKIRTTAEPEEKQDALSTVIETIKADTPAIFLFTPTFSHVQHKDVTLSKALNLSNPSERFNTIAQWHLQSNNVWPIFTD